MEIDDESVDSLELDSEYTLSGSDTDDDQNQTVNELIEHSNNPGGSTGSVLASLNVSVRVGNCRSFNI